MPSLVDQKKYQAIKFSKKFSSTVWSDSRQLKLWMEDEKYRQKLKKLIRESIPNEIRSLVWPQIMRLSTIAEHDYDFVSALKSINIQPEDLVKYTASNSSYPTFGGAIDFSLFALSPYGESVVKVILILLSHDFPLLEYSPMLPNVVALLLHNLNEDQVYGIAKIMVSQAQRNDKWMYLPINLQEMMHFYQVFAEVAQQIAPKIVKHLRNISNNSDLWIKWINEFLLNSMDIGCEFRMLDSFLMEGYKVIIRYGVAMLILRGPQMLKCTNVQQLDELMLKEEFKLGIDDDKLSDTAFNIYLSRNQIEGLKVKVKTDLLASGNSADMTLSPQDYKVMPMLKSQSSFMKDQDWKYLYQFIPKKYKGHFMKLLFSTEIHGYRLASLYKECAIEAPQVLLIQTLDDHILGAFLSDSWQGHSLDGRFFGSSETFLFTLAPHDHAYRWVGFHVHADNAEQVKALTDGASLFISGTNKYMAIGGGGAHFGLSIDESLTKGTTNTCKTFHNKSLHSRHSFEIKSIEVWHFM
ncbi:hypothetical protein MP228_011002 [Amoeboaphelidium protococcarum]|nr:hypothetical protein MP228_011002 [Amoeboaphelidium protococcarum]